MKKIVVYLCFIVLVCFFIPILFTNKAKLIDTVEVTSNVINNEIIENENNVDSYDYKEYNIIKLLHKDTGNIEEIDLDKYLTGVISAEMPVSYDIEALKSQAIVARTYTLYKIINSKVHGNEANICDNYQCCQAWISKELRFEKWDDSKENEFWNKILLAVNETKGKVITYDGKVINAFFHANSGGKTEIPINVWGGSNYPYLQVVETSGEEGYSQYNSEIELTIDELTNCFKEIYNDLNINIENLKQTEDEIKILEYTESGRVRTIKLGNKNISGIEVRKILNLKSTNFDIQINKENLKIKFNVIGYGHGIGMSQTGADAMAKQGSDYEQIIKHFYKDVEIVDI